MSVPAGLRSFLLGDAAISNLVGAVRIHPIVLPQGQVATSITYSRISGDRPHNTEGASGLSGPRVQIDCWSQDFDTCQELAEAVRQRIDGWRGDMNGVTVQGVFFANERDFFDSEPGLYRVSRDYFIWFKET